LGRGVTVLGGRIMLQSLVSQKCVDNLASMLSHQGKYEQAEEIHRQAFGLRETVLGKEYPSPLTSMSNKW